MHKSLNAESLGISARQNELIELALTYGFAEFDFDLSAFLKHVESRGPEQATRFVHSANIKVGCFDLPLDFSAEETAYRADVEKFLQSAQVLQSLGASTGIANLSPFSDTRPYHEDFELHGQRISELGRALEPFGMGVGLSFVAPAHHREGHAAQFACTPEAVLTMIKTIADKNVGLCLDPWHWHVAGQGLEQIEGLSVDRICAVRIADLPADADLATVTERDRLIPGSTGVVPLTAWWRWLVDNEYEGPIAAYCHPELFAGRKRNETVQKIAESLKQLTASISVEQSAEVEESEPAPTS